MTSAEANATVSPIHTGGILRTVPPGQTGLAGRHTAPGMKVLPDHAWPYMVACVRAGHPARCLMVRGILYSITHEPGSMTG